MRYLMIILALALAAPAVSGEEPEFSRVIGAALEKHVPDQPWTVTVQQQVIRESADKQQQKRLASSALELAWTEGKGVSVRRPEKQEKGAVYRFHADPAEFLRDLAAATKQRISRKDGKWVLYGENTAENTACSLVIDEESGLLEAAEVFVNGRLFITAGLTCRQTGGAWLVDTCQLRFSESGLTIVQQYGDYRFGAEETGARVSSRAGTENTAGARVSSRAGTENTAGARVSSRAGTENTAGARVSSRAGTENTAGARVSSRAGTGAEMPEAEQDNE
jgi:hypothetical protein